MRFLIGASGLAALWLLMSGLFDKPLILAFGVASVGLAMLISVRMDRADGEQLTYAIGILPAARYTLWLLWEIAKSNWTVTKLILSGREPDRQKLFMIPVTQKSDICQVVFANSITLTPGTITVEPENDQFIVHALEFDEATMDALADMDRRVTAVETLETEATG